MGNFARRLLDPAEFGSHPARRKGEKRDGQQWLLESSGAQVAVNWRATDRIFIYYDKDAEGKIVDVGFLNKRTDERVSLFKPPPADSSQ
jgi:hypothetical protein